jgi:hypothetical protein
MGDSELEGGQTKDPPVDTVHVLGSLQQPAKREIITMEVKLFVFKVNPALLVSEKDS